ncbi:MAG: TVP38/TMEM64 family protein [Rhodanobacteraceae bacterium]
MKRLRAFLPLLVLIAIGVALIATGALDRFRPERLGAEQLHLREQIALHPIVAALAQIALVMLAISTGIPGAIVLVLAGGMLFGVVTGTLLSSVGTTLGALILFLASRSAFAHGTGGAPLLVEKLRAGYHAFPLSYTMFLRLVPFFPFGGVTVALAWLRCPLWLFLGATAIGGTVMIAFETALGAGLAETIAREGHVSFNMFAHPHVLVPMLGMAVLALVPIVLGQLRRLSKKPEIVDKESGIEK